MAETKITLTQIEGMALALAEGGLIEARYGDAVPQDVWSGLYDRDLIRVGRDFVGEFFTALTNEGRDALLEHVTALPLPSNDQTKEDNHG